MLVAILPDSVRKGRRTSVVKALISNSRAHSRGSPTNRSRSNRGTISSRGSGFSEKIEYRLGERIYKDKALTIKPQSVSENKSVSHNQSQGKIDLLNPPQPKLKLLDLESQSTIERPEARHWDRKMTFQASQPVNNGVRFSGSLMSEGSPSRGPPASKPGLEKLDSFSRRSNQFQSLNQNANQSQSQNQNQQNINSENPFSKTQDEQSPLSESNMTNAFGKCASNSSIPETPQSDDFPH